MRHDHDLASTVGVGPVEGGGQIGLGDLDEAGDDVAVAALLTQQPAQPHVIGVSLGDAAAAPQEDHAGLARCPLAEGGGDPFAGGGAQQRVRTQVLGVADRSAAGELSATLDALGNVFADMPAGADHQRHHHDMIVGRLGQGRGDRILDRRSVEFDVGVVDRHAGQQRLHPLDQRTAGLLPLGKAGAVGGDDQRAHFCSIQL